MFNKTSRSDQYCVAARNPIFTISSSSETFCTSSVVSRETNEAIDKRRFFDVKGDVVSVEVPTRRLLEFRDDTKEVFFFILLVDQTDVSLNYGLAARQFQTLRIFVLVKSTNAIVFVFSVGVEVWVVQRFVCGDSS